MAEMNFGGVVETVVTSKEFSLEKAREVLKNETIAVIGYGVQGPGQACNLRDNGFNVIVGQRQGKTYDKAVADGWVPGETLFSIEEAAEKGTILCMLLSDAGQIQQWPTIKKYLKPGKTLYYSHGFAINWSDRTGVVPPKDVDVIMVAPKGSGTSLRTMFCEGRGLNCSYAVYQDATGKATEKTLAFGIGIGAGYMFETTFQREATSDLTGERGSLMGAIQGLLLAQYEVLREHGHSPSEAFNETVEELTQSLGPLFGAWSGCTTLYRQVMRRRSLSTPTLSPTTVQVLRRSLRPCVIRRCGVPVRPYANFAQRIKTYNHRNAGTQNERPRASF